MASVTYLDWAICRRDEREPLITFADRAGAVAHYRRLGCPPDLRVIRQETTVRRVFEHVRPLVEPVADPFAIPESIGARA